MREDAVFSTGASRPDHLEAARHCLRAHPRQAAVLALRSLKDGRRDRGRTDGDAFWAWEILGRSHLFLGRPRRALRAFAAAAASATAAEKARLDCLRVRPLLLLDRSGEAGEAARRALAWSDLDGDRLSRVRARIALSDWSVHVGEPEQALRACREARRLLREASRNPVQLAASLALARANALAGTHRFGAARRQFAKAAALLSADDVGLRLRVEYDEARAEARSGRFAVAARAFLRIQKTMRRLGYDRLLGRIQLERAEIELRLDRPGEAHALAAEAHDWFAAAGLRLQQARAHHVAACAAARVGDLFLAVDALSDAERIYAQLRALEPWVNCLVQLGGVCLDHGRIAEAKAAAERAAALLNARAHPLTRATVELLKARLDLASGAPTRALHRVDAIRMDTRGQHAPWLHIELHRLMGRCYAVRGENVEAIVALQHAIVVLERFRGGGAPPEHHAAFQRSRRELHAETADLMARTGNPALAFAVAERARAYALVQLMADDTTAGRAHLEPATARRLRTLRERLNATYDFLLRAGSQGLARGEERVAAAREEARQLEATIDDLLEEARRRTPGAATLHTVGAIDLAAVRAQLDPDTVLLEYTLMPDGLLAFVVSRDRLRVVRQDVPEGELRRLAEQFRFHLRKFDEGASFAASVMLPATRRVLDGLAMLLLEPLGDLAPAQKLIVVPDGVLHSVPFHALPLGEGWLADRYEVTYAPSAAAFAAARMRHPKATGPAAVLGLADEAAPELHASARMAAHVLRTERIALDDGATLRELVEKGESARILHVATRNMLCNAQPMQSGLRLADGWLDLYRLCDLRLPAEMVVLSLADCGSARLTDGAETLGLTTAVLQAGARALLANRWNVGPAAVEFLQIFYGLLEETGDPAAAHRETMARIRAQNPHPYYWAAFFLSGCPVVRRFRDDTPAGDAVRRVVPLPATDRRHRSRD